MVDMNKIQRLVGTEALILPDRSILKTDILSRATLLCMISNRTHRIST